MRGILARKIVVMAVLCIWTPFAAESDAGFEWIGWWQEHSSGMATFFSGSDEPWGVRNAGARIEGYFASSDALIWPNPQSPEASTQLARHFSLTGSPEGWKVDLEWNQVQRSISTIHTIFQGFAAMDILPEPDFGSGLDSAATRSIFLPDGDYWFMIEMRGELTRPSPPFDVSPFAGSFKIQNEWSLHATAVPEPSSILTLSQGAAAILVLYRISKRSKTKSNS